MFFPGAGNDNRPLKLMLSAGLAGAISRTVTAPLDRIKFLMIMGNPGLKEKYTVRQVRPHVPSCGPRGSPFRVEDAPRGLAYLLVAYNPVLVARERSGGKGTETRPGISPACKMSFLSFSLLLACPFLSCPVLT